MKELTLEQRARVKALTAERAKMSPDDDIFRGAEVDAMWIHRILAEQAAQYERRLMWWQRGCAVLTMAVIFLLAWIFQ